MKDYRVKNNDLILSLQGLRGIMFLIIFFFHSELFLKGYTIYDSFLIGGGVFSVSVFFVLSGFVNGLSNRFISNWKEYMQFLQKTLSKFYLPHIIFLILSLPVSFYFLIYTVKGKIVLLLDALLLQSWVPDTEVWLSYNGVAWFLSTLMFCYAVVPSVQRIWRRVERCDTDKQCRIIYLFLILVYVVSVVVWVCVKDNVIYWLYAFPPVRLLDFFGGYALAKLFRIRRQDENRKYKLNRGGMSVLEIVMFAICAILMFVYPYVDEGFRRQALQMPFSFCLVYILAEGRGCISEFLSTKWIVLMGNYSFYYYISHQVVYKWIYKIYERSPLIVSGTFIIDFMIVMICLIITIVSRRIYENIIRRIIL